MGTATSLRETIVSDLRAAILDGRYAPGSALPSAHDLCETYGTSRVTVRRALEMLRADGLIDIRQGAVPRVRTTPSVRIAIVAGDWRRHRDAGRPGFNATVAEHGLIGRQEILRVEDGVTPPGHIADLLDLDDHELVVMRAIRMWADEAPSRLVHVWFPASWASGTALTQKRRIRGGVAGLIEQMHGRLADSAIDLEGRLSTAIERELLMLPPGTQMIHTTTVFLNGADEPVYVQEESADATRHRWRFRVPL